MAQTSSIEWCQATLNPWTGCTKVDPACAHCYIENTPPFRIAGRKFVRGHIPLVFHMGRLDAMVRRRKPTLYFVNSLSDLFHEDASDDQIAQVFAAMALAPQHTFQALTKRHERMRALMRSRAFVALVDDGRAAMRPGCGDFDWPLLNVWLGVTIGNRRFVHRADVLRQTPAAVRFISAEPLLGPLVYDDRSADGHYATAGLGADEVVGDTTIWHRHWRDDFDGDELDLADIDWLICGGESGPKHRPFNAQHARDLRDACAASGTAYFVKQFGGTRPGTALEDLPADLRIREYPAARP